MGFHIRKTKKAGLFNFNLSNSGVGTSFGIKGLRTGVDSKGRTYIRGGKGFLRYNKYLGNVEIPYKPSLFNSFAPMNFLWGLLIFCNFIFCFHLSFIPFLLFAGLFHLLPANAINNHPFLVLLLFILSIYSIKWIWHFCYAPNFYKKAKSAEKWYKLQNFEFALNRFEEAKEMLNNSKIYDCTPEFAQWLENYIADCKEKLNIE